MANPRGTITLHQALQIANTCEVSALKGIDSPTKASLGTSFNPYGIAQELVTAAARRPKDRSWALKIRNEWEERVKSRTITHPGSECLDDVTDPIFAHFPDPRTLYSFPAQWNLEEEDLD
jgi:hypothetical protein